MHTRAAGMKGFRFSVVIVALGAGACAYGAQNQTVVPTCDPDFDATCATENDTGDDGSDDGGGSPFAIPTGDDGTDASIITPPSSPSHDAAAPVAIVDAAVDAGNDGDANACIFAPSLETCESCCAGSEKAAFPKWLQNFGNCNCRFPGGCASACGGESFCGGGTPSLGDACDVCLKASETSPLGCGQLADIACSLDADCAPFSACTTAAGCATKP